MSSSSFLMRGIISSSSKSFSEKISGGKISEHICLKAAFNHNNREYQIASGKLYTVLQIAKMFNTRIKMIPERPGERFTSKRDNLKKTFKELKFKPAHNIREYVKNFKNNN